jgi:imidazolonepropionase-like amidohydrolase/ABC-type multidrug transport system permease subunit
MKAPFALLAADLRVSWRDRTVLFFNYAFPLTFFFLFGTLMEAGKSLGSAHFIVSTVIAIGIMGNGFFGVGMRAVQERELGILRRLRLAPITPAPILFSSLVSGVLVYLPGALLTLFCANRFYHMPIPSNLTSLFAFIIVGSLAFRSMGLIIAAVADSMQQAQILIQIFYIPMLFLSGTTFPMNNLPKWIQTAASFMPATYLKSGLDGILQNGESFAANSRSIAALVATFVVGFIVSFNLFRWDKEDRIPTRSKAWITAVLVPFLILGAWEIHAGTNSARQTIAYRQLGRSHNWRVHDVRVFVGDGQVLDQADVYVQNGKIVDVVEAGQPAPPDSASYSVIEGAGKTLLPGLIDVHAHFGASGITMSEGFDKEMTNWPGHAVRSYLYCGVTAAKSTGDVTADLLKVKHRITAGEILGTELFMVGPLFTAPGGHGTEYFRNMPEAVRKTMEPEMSAAYSTPAEATSRVDTLAAQGVDGIKVVLESGGAGMLFERLDLAVFDAVAAAARRRSLPVVVHTSTPQDIRDAIARDVAGIEHGSTRDLIPDDLIKEIVSKQVRYDPTLTVFDSFQRISVRDASMLEDSLARQTIPAKLLAKMQRWIHSNEIFKDRSSVPPIKQTAAVKNLVNLYHAGVPLVLGTDAGNYGTFHGSAVHREMELWQEAGIPQSDILKAATSNAAQLLGAGNRIGKVAKGYEASLLIVDGNPLEDIRGTRRISDVFFKGERVRRSELFPSADSER